MRCAGDWAKKKIHCPSSRPEPCRTWRRWAGVIQKRHGASILSLANSMRATGGSNAKHQASPWELRRIGARISLDAERAAGAREHTEKSHWEPFQRRTDVAQKPAFANNFRVRCGRVTDPAQCRRRLGRAPDRRSGPKNREIGFEEQGTFFE